VSPTVTVHLPGPLRERAARRTSVPARGATVRDIIADLDRQYPGLRFHLCEETGELRPFVNIFIETQSVRDLQGLDSPVSDGASLYVLHSVAGGGSSLHSWGGDLCR